MTNGDKFHGGKDDDTKKTHDFAEKDEEMKKPPKETPSEKPPTKEPPLQDKKDK